MTQLFHQTAKIALILIYLVILAGAVVRMTGSGMGCPDWPKCFGYYIPPTEASALQFKPDHHYSKGHIIILNDSLWVAKKDFTSSESISLEQWSPYTTHDYATYNPLHTWIEYINRLLGALSGLPILLLAFLSLKRWKINRWNTVVGILTLIGIGFQAWLGKTVVDSNLAPFKITIHMVMALVIVVFLIYQITSSNDQLIKIEKDQTFKYLVLFTLTLSLVQIVLGTQVRQFVDTQIKSLGDIPALWMSKPLVNFYWHRSMSILILLTNIGVFWRNRSKNLPFKSITLWILLMIGIEVLSGILMFYFDFPFSTQPIHLMMATILFGLQFYLWMTYKKQTQHDL